jgi:hypothetical protein
MTGRGQPNPPEWATAVGLNYRTLDYWARCGYLKPLGGIGTGHRREWPELEQQIGALMVRLIAAGFTPSGASDVARTALVAPTNGRTFVNIGDGLTLEVTK